MTGCPIPIDSKPAYRIIAFLFATAAGVSATTDETGCVKVL